MYYTAGVNVASLHAITLVSPKDLDSVMLVRLSDDDRQLECLVFDSSSIANTDFF